MSLGQCIEQTKVLLAELEGLLVGFKQLSDVVEQESGTASLECNVPLQSIFPDVAVAGAVRVQLNHEACLEAVAATGREILDRWQQLHAVAGEAVASCTQAFQDYEAPAAQEAAPPAAVEGATPG